MDDLVVDASQGARRPIRLQFTISLVPPSCMDLTRDGLLGDMLSGWRTRRSYQESFLT